MLIITALLIMQLPVSEADAATSASDFKMEGKTLVKYLGRESDVSIPNTVEVIGTGAFEDNSKLEKVTIPSSVKAIEAYAFWGCENLDTVVLGNGLTEVGDFAFANCMGLTKMSIPDNISSIGIHAFADCVNMTDITIAPEVTNIHETAFDGCYRLTIHCEPGTIAADFAESFYEKQKEMPEYEDVSNYTPDDTKEDDTEEVVVSEPESGGLLASTKIVGTQAVIFVDNTSLEVQTQADGIENGVILGGNGFVPGEGDSVPKYTIVDGTIIADQAYYRNQTLKDIAIPEGICEIGQFSFARSSATEVSIPDGVQKIGYGAFYHCDDLTKVSLPETIMLVEPKAFSHSAWVDHFLETGDSDFLISGGVLVAYRGTSGTVTVPEGVRIIAGEAFFGHAEINELILPDSLISIGEGAFEGCSSIHTLIVGENLQQIKDRAFYGCPLSQVKLPASVTEMGINCFEDNVIINYEGEIPDSTHELSAERLSNESYRVYPDGEDTPGVQVNGMEGATATLEGALRSYTLTMEEIQVSADMEDAYYRCFQDSLAADSYCYSVCLNDSSGIPITKTGKQQLQITLPVPEALKDRSVQLFCLDRNGQLEAITSQRVKIDGVDCVRFDLCFLSEVVMTGVEIPYDATEVIEETTTIVNMSAPVAAENNGFGYQGLLGASLLAAGIGCMIWKRKI